MDIDSVRCARGRSLGRKGHGIEVLGISETELFAADFGTETRGTPDFDAILRFDLSELESFATKL